MALVNKVFKVQMTEAYTEHLTQVLSGEPTEILTWVMKYNDGTGHEGTALLTQDSTLEFITSDTNFVSILVDTVGEPMEDEPPVLAGTLTVTTIPGFYSTCNFEISDASFSINWF